MWKIWVTDLILKINYCDKQNFIKQNISDFQNGGVLHFEKIKLYVATPYINKTYLGTSFMYKLNDEGQRACGLRLHYLQTKL